MGERGYWKGWLILAAGFIVTGVAAAQVSCDQAISEANAHYTSGSFSDAINVLAPCVRTYSPGTDEDREAHRLLALAYLRAGDIEESRLVVVELFARNPDYEADPVSDPPAFVSLVNLVREETGVDSLRSGSGSSSPLRTWFRSPTTWLIVAGGAAVTTAIVLVSASGNGSGTDMLPPPPAFP